jgi:hypothetical protein
MKKSELAKKRRALAAQAARDALRVLSASRRDVARIIRPWRIANRRLQLAMARLDTLDEPSADVGNTRELLECLVSCLNDERERVTMALHRIQASQLSRGEDL